MVTMSAAARNFIVGFRNRGYYVGDVWKNRAAFEAMVRWCVNGGCSYGVDDELVWVSRRRKTIFDEIRECC